MRVKSDRGLVLVCPMDAGISFEPCGVDDFETLLAIRMDAMRESLERLGRFDPQRARERLERSFYPEFSRFIIADGIRIGFHTFRPAQDGFHLEHFYILPAYQSRGIGSSVLKMLIVEGEKARLPIYLGALKQSPANRFYERQGFVKNAESEWDIYYVWRP
jgi:GNAT superfamily N-acetyltransferase